MLNISTLKTVSNTTIPFWIYLIERDSRFPDALKEFVDGRIFVKYSFDSDPTSLIV